MKSAAVILNSDDLMLSGEVYIPEGNGKTFPAVCLCHGIPAVPYNPDERGGYPELAAKFCEAGFVALAFNFRGAGPSQGNMDMPGWIRDLISAIDFLYMLPEVDKEKLCLLGSSAGAAVSVCVAAKEPRIHAVAALACPAEFDFISSGYSPQYMVDNFRRIGIIKDPDFPPSFEQWMEGFRMVKPVDCIRKLAPRPVLIIHGDKDESVPLSDAGRLYDAAGAPKEMTIISGAGHRLRLDNRAINAALDWLKEQTK